MTTMRTKLWMGVEMSVQPSIRFPVTGYSELSSVGVAEHTGEVGEFMDGGRVCAQSSSGVGN